MITFKQILISSLGTISLILFIMLNQIEASFYLMGAAILMFFYCYNRLIDMTEEALITEKTGLFIKGVIINFLCVFCLSLGFCIIAHFPDIFSFISGICIILSSGTILTYNQILLSLICNSKDVKVPRES